ncbi:unnamed protein product [Acanthoscelides obtectus]|uniref:PiggyBac transposable element-derived protein domain-containing protein n=1 Tax=Acanthoscelides obtectus TaxID=200917 RepID=A0A9P0NVE0_ACAOB|nr:unnamed protein product [Acanthoscelides obtectus]CAK1625862.1 PiggyBac transposable element-derived protein 5 [Acanthoscelides obtectus]
MVQHAKQFCRSSPEELLKELAQRRKLFLSNYQNPVTMGRVLRRRDEVACPQMVIEYNTHMGYVDKFDMLKSLYELNRKSHKWWHRIFFYFVDACIVNASILFRLRSKSNEFENISFGCIQGPHWRSSSFQTR